MAALSATSVWVVGAVAVPVSGGEGGAYKYESVALHWNGSAWSTYKPAGASLNGIVVRSSSNIWAVGTQDVGGIIVHWNGQHWQQEPSPAYLYGTFNDAKASSTGEMWAGGSTISGQQQVTLTARSPSNKAAVQGNTGASAAVVTWVGPTTGTVSCDISGNYVAPDLPPGTYSFVASLTGCAPGTAILTVSPDTIVNQNLPVSCEP